VSINIQEIVLSGMVLSLANGRQPPEPIRAGVMRLCNIYGVDAGLGVQILEGILGGRHEDSEYIVDLAGEYVLSERGRALLDVARKKAAVADLIGEPALETNLDADDLAEILRANPDIPG
jgi:hypothetical protein